MVFQAAAVHKLRYQRFSLHIAFQYLDNGPYDAGMQPLVFLVMGNSPFSCKKVLLKQKRETYLPPVFVFYCQLFMFLASAHHRL